MSHRLRFFIPGILTFQGYQRLVPDRSIWLSGNRFKPSQLCFLSGWDILSSRMMKKCRHFLKVPVKVSLPPCAKLDSLASNFILLKYFLVSNDNRIFVSKPVFWWQGSHFDLSQFVTKQAAAHSYAKRFDLIQYLDATYGAVECPRGCGSSYLRQFASGHMDVCLHTKKKCPLCFQFYTGSRREHEVHCRLREDHEVHHQLRLLGYGDF